MIVRMAILRIGVILYAYEFEGCDEVIGLQRGKARAEMVLVEGGAVDAYDQ